MNRNISKTEILLVVFLGLFFIVVFPALHAGGVISDVTLYQ